MNRKAVAPVIATLLLVAIAVVGGSIIFVFSQGFFESIQTNDDRVEMIKYTKHIDYCAWDYCWSFYASAFQEANQPKDKLRWKVEIFSPHDGLQFYFLDGDEKLPSPEELCMKGIDMSEGIECEHRIIIENQEKLLEQLENSN